MKPALTTKTPMTASNKPVIGFNSPVPLTQPLEFEIGCGKGRFLIDRAGHHPHTGFIGIDIWWRFLKFAVKRVENLGLSNIRFYKAEAFDFLQNVLPDQSVSVFHIYFPDPWPKKRQKKNRLFSKEFLELASRKSTDNAVIRVTTDHEDYYLQMCGTVIASEGRWAVQSKRSGISNSPDDTPTHYEAKYRAEGRTLHYAEFVKRTVNSVPPAFVDTKSTAPLR
ncbi:MAG: tRNA (guanosine(46)-N7)-methyltransferase TrmB [Candidatus Omnitrophica bacterium]|nr:tRNA (guanosine(46)-N7)-methyltransferase TrmB [Candidatus Omnitrophota bacterium]